METLLSTMPGGVVAALFVLAGAFALRAAQLAYAGRAIFNPPGNAVPELVLLMRAFRVLVVGVLVAGVAAGAAFESVTLFWVVTAICAEEFYESSMALGVLRKGFATEGA
jgi:hypothetical protein